MKRYVLKSGTIVEISDTKIRIIRNDVKSAAKGLLSGRAMGEVSLKLSSVTGLIQNTDILLICASGLPSPNDFKISNFSEIKQYPNCIVGKNEELLEIYLYLSEML